MWICWAGWQEYQPVSILGYPPYDDAPKEGEFDWDGFTRNLAIGLGVVAVCAIGAAISIATLVLEVF